MSTEPDPAAILAILDDAYSRTILEATRQGPKSGKELSEECEMSRATVSRRVNELVEHGLLVERTHVDPGGHHYSEYEAVLDRVVVRLDADGFAVRVDRREDAPDRLARLWKEIRET